MKTPKLILPLAIATALAVPATAQNWVSAGGGNWDDNANWSAAYPDAVGASVVINPSSGGTIGNTGTDTSFLLNSLVLGGTANNNAITLGSASTLVFSNSTPILNFVNGTSSASARSIQATIDATASGLSIRAGGASGSVDAVNTISGNLNATGQTLSFDNSSVSGSVGQRLITVTGNITAANLNNTRTASTLTLQGANTISGAVSLSGAGGTTFIRRADAGSATAAAITPFGTAGVTLSNGHRLTNSVTSYSNAIILANTITVGVGGGTIDVGSSGDTFELGTSANALTGTGTLTVTSQSTSDPTSTNIDGVQLLLKYGNDFSGQLNVGSGTTNGFIDARATGATGTGALVFAGTGNMAVRTSNTGGTVQLNNSSWSITGNGGRVLIGGDAGSTTRLTGTFSNTGNSALHLGRNSAYGTSGGDQTIDLQGTGSLSNNIASTGTSTVRLLLSNTTGTQTFGGNLTTGSGAGALRVERNGAGGTTILSGANAYTGTTTVTAGTLLLNGTHTGGGNYSITGTFGGNGTLTPAAAATFTVNSGGVVAAGDAIGSIGTLTFDGVNRTGAVATFSAGAKFNFDLNGTASTSDKIQLNNGATGDFVFNNNVIDFTSITGTLVNNSTYVLFSATAADNFTGLTLDGGNRITGGLLIGTGMESYAGSYLSVVGADIVLTAVPEPSSFAVFAGLGTLGFAAMRRRRRA